MRNHATAGGGAVDDYIAMFPPAAKQVLEELRALVLTLAPDSAENLRHGIISYTLDGHDLVQFGGWQRHVGFYPVTAAMEDAFGDELKPYKSGKGSLRFLLEQPLPLELVRRIVQHRLGELAGGERG